MRTSSSTAVGLNLDRTLRTVIEHNAVGVEQRQLHAFRRCDIDAVPGPRADFEMPPTKPGAISFDVWITLCCRPESTSRHLGGHHVSGSSARERVYFQSLSDGAPCFLSLLYVTIEHMFDAMEEELKTTPPGPRLAAILSRIDTSELSGYDRVVVLKAHRKMASYYAAQGYQAIVAISETMHDMFDDDYELAHRAAATEIRAGLSLTRRAADGELELALDLVERLPRVWAALAAGDIDVPKARVIVTGTRHLTVVTARKVTEQIIDDAPGLTTGQLRVRIAKLCITADPDEALNRYETAVEERRVVVEPSLDGTAHLIGYDLPADRAMAISRRINRLARKLKTRHETRAIDQLRADVFLDLLDGHHTSRGGHDRGVVDIQVDLTTLVELDETAGELAGYGPIIAEIARQTADEQHSSQWRWTVTDPDTGMPIHEGTTRRRPTGRQRRHVEARDRNCVFPGCRMPARNCDLDHRIPWSRGGPTHRTYLAPVCRHDHTNRHLCGWTYRPLRNGDYLWTSPLGHHYTSSGKPP
jgi:hypothetical protein